MQKLGIVAKELMQHFEGGILKVQKEVVPVQQKNKIE